MALRVLWNRRLTRAGTVLVMAGIFVGGFSIDVMSRDAYIFWSVLFGLGLSSLSFTLIRESLFPLKFKASRQIGLRTVTGSVMHYSVELNNLTGHTLRNVVLREEESIIRDLVKNWKSTNRDRIKWQSYSHQESRLHFRKFRKHINQIETGHKKRIRMELKFPDRGVYSLKSLRLERTCPLGLTRAGRTLQEYSRIIVHPEQYHIGKVNMNQVKVLQPGGVPYSASIGESNEFASLREYRPGDSFKKINWKAWARRGKPVVIETQGEYFRRVALVLNTRKSGSNSGKSSAEFEAAVSVTASLAAYFEKNEFIIDIFAAGNQIFYLQAGMNLSHMENVLDLLAAVESVPEANLPVINDALRSILSRLSGLVFITSEFDEKEEKFCAEISGSVPEIKTILVSHKNSVDQREGLDGRAGVIKRVRPDYLEEDLLEL